MSVVPVSREGKINFFASKVAPWTASATAIGTTTSAVTALDAKVQTAQDKLAAAIAARAAAETATEDLNLAVRDMGVAGADIIKAIRAKAAVAGDSVYILAQLPIPATPAPRPAPGKPTGLKVALDDNGALELSWKCPNPPGGGVIYQVYRATGASEDFAYLGGVGSRKFTDSTVPAGATRLTYQIQAARSTAVGPWATFVVSFGSGSNGATVSMLNAPAAGPKIAA